MNPSILRNFWREIRFSTSRVEFSTLESTRFDAKKGLAFGAVLVHLYSSMGRFGTERRWSNLAYDDTVRWVGCIRYPNFSGRKKVQGQGVCCFSICLGIGEDNSMNQKRWLEIEDWYLYRKTEDIEKTFLEMMGGAFFWRLNIHSYRALGIQLPVGNGNGT